MLTYSFQNGFPATNVNVNANTNSTAASAINFRRYSSSPVQPRQVSIRQTLSENNYKESKVQILPKLSLGSKKSSIKKNGNNKSAESMESVLEPRESLPLNIIVAVNEEEQINLEKRHKLNSNELEI